MTKLKLPKRITYSRDEIESAERIPMSLSDEGAFLTQASVIKAFALKKLHVKHKHVDMLGAVTTRNFLPVAFFGRKQLADVVTGSLFDIDSGKCLTGSSRLVEEEVAHKSVKAIRTQGTPFNNALRKPGHRKEAA